MSDETASTPTESNLPVQNVDVGPVLLRGAWSALAAGALCASASVIEAIRGDEPGFTITTVLAILALVPLTIVVVAFARLVRAVDPVALNSLRKSGICVFVLLLLLILSGALIDLFPDAANRSAYLALLVMSIGCLVLLRYSMGSGSFMVALFAYLVIKYLVGWLTIGRRFDSLDAFVAVGAFLLCISLVAYPIWFANCLRRARAQLGSPAIGVAVVLFACLLTTVAFFVAMSVELATTPGAENMTDKEMDDVLAPIVQRFNLIGAFLELAFACVVASLFLSVRQRLRATNAETRPV